MLLHYFVNDLLSFLPFFLSDLQASETLSRYSNTSDYTKQLNLGNQLPNNLIFGNPVGETTLFHSDGEHGDETLTSCHLIVSPQRQSLNGENVPNVQHAKFIENRNQVADRKKR